MSVSYKKLWKLLIDKDMKKKDLCEKAGINNEGKVIREDDYFPGLVKAHLDRGAKLLEDEKRYSKDFYNHLCHLDDNI